MRQEPPSWMERVIPVVLIGLGAAALIALLIAIYVLAAGT